MKRLTSFFYIFLMLFSLGHAQSWVDSSPMTCDEVQGQIESDGTNLFYLTTLKNTFTLELNTFDGSQWQAFGSPTFNSLQIVGEKPVLSMKGSTPYIFYVDVSGDLNVIYYDGSSWQYLGGQEFHSPQGTIARVSFDASGNQPYLSYIDSRDNFQVKVWTYDGSSWQNLPAAGQGSISFTCIRTSGSTPYVAFVGRPPFNTLTFVKKYNGSAWVDVGLPLFASGSGSKCINFYNGEPYILLYDRANNALPTVKKFNGSSWVNIGPAGFSAVNPDGGRIIFDGATPYVNLSRGNGLSEVRKFDGTNWVTMGTFPFPNANLDFCRVGTDFYVVNFIRDRTTFSSYLGVKRYNPSGSFSPLYSPAANCQDITVSLDPTGANSLAVSQIDNGSSDACALSSMDLSPSTFDCQSGSFPVTLTVSSFRHVSSSCTATVTVNGAGSNALSPQGCNACNEIRINLCKGDPAPQLDQVIEQENSTYQQGATLLWYEDNNGSQGTALNATPIIDNQQKGTRYYWVAQGSGACPSQAIRVRVRVKNTFVPDFTLPTLSCTGSQVDLTDWVSDPKNKATAYTFYDVDPTTHPSASPIGSATASKGVVDFGQYVLVSIGTGSQTYWVQSTVPNGCGGIASSTLAPGVQYATLDPISPVTVMHGEPVNLSFSGQNQSYILWLDHSSFNNPAIGLMGIAGMGNLAFTAYNTGGTALTAMIRVIAYNGNCAGEVVDFNITVLPASNSRTARPDQLHLAVSSLGWNRAALNWDISSKKALIRFEIEKKQANGEFLSLGAVNWAGDGSYTFEDLGEIEPENTYRLTMIFEDGTVVWSKEVDFVRENSRAERFSISPNPVQDRMWLKADFELTESHPWSLSDTYGKTMLTGHMTQQMTSVSLSSLPEGIYYLRLSTMHGNSQVIKVFKK